MKQGKTAAWSAVQTVFLDRDGVINEKAPDGDYVRRPKDLKLLKGATHAIARLNRAGVRVVVVTNQRGVALGLYGTDDVRAIQAALERLLAADGAHFDGFYFCPHDVGACNCRKPLTGLFDQARVDFPEIEAASSVMIGDSLSDIEFGRAVGMRTILLEGDPELHGRGTGPTAPQADGHFASLAQAVDLLLRQSAPKSA